MTTRSSRAPLTASVVLAALAGGASAQSLYTVNGSTGQVGQFTGPPAGACSYPAGPVLNSFSYLAGGPCPMGAFAAPPSLLGDIAIDRANDVVYVSDGSEIARYTSAGALIGVFSTVGLTPPVNGMGFDAATGRVWVTNGTFAAAILPSASACGAPTIAVSPFALPIVPGAAPYTDIDFHPGSGSLLACTANGYVVSVLPGGAPGPFGTFLVAPGVCGLAQPLTGIAVDAAAPPASGRFFVGNATMTAYLSPGGAAAPLTPYRTATCAAPAVPPSSGLAFAARPLPFGAGGGAPLPAIAATGQSVTPNPSFAIQLTGASPAAPAFLYVGATSACPALVLPPPVLLGLAPMPMVFATKVTTAAGAATAPAPLPAGMTPPIAAYFQWFVVGGAGIASSRGLQVNVSLR